MNTVMLEVKEGKLQADFAKRAEQLNQQNSDQILAMQQEIIIKERRIGDLERKLRQRDEEIAGLKTERDRLVQISGELAGKLSIAERRLFEQAQDALDVNDESKINYMDMQDLRIQVDELKDNNHKID